MPYQVLMEGEAIELTSRATLKNYYGEQDATYFMFAWNIERMPALRVRYVSLETAAGEPLPVFEKQTGDGEKWFVDVKDMPPVGTEIIMKGVIDSTNRGFFTAATLVVPFNYRWEDVQMSDGEQAKLYAFTQIGVNKESLAGGGPAFGKPGGKLPVPGLEAALAVPAIAVVALVVARATRRA